MTLATAMPETRSPRLVTIQPDDLAHWRRDLDGIVEKANRYDRSLTSAINDIRSRMAAVANVDGPVSIIATEPLTWGLTLMFTAHKIGAQDVAGVVHTVGASIAEAAGSAVAK